MFTADPAVEVLHSLPMTNAIVMNEGMVAPRLTSSVVITHILPSHWICYDHPAVGVLHSLSMTNAIVINEGMSAPRLTSSVVITHILPFSLDLL